MNLVTELKSYLQNSEKKGRTQGTAYERATCYSYRLSNYKFSAEDESTSRLHLKSPLRKRVVERVKLKTENYFPDRKFDMDLA